MMGLLTVVILSFIVFLVVVVEVFAIYTSNLKSKVDRFFLPIFVLLCTIAEVLIGSVILGILERM